MNINNLIKLLDQNKMNDYVYLLDMKISKELILHIIFEYFFIKEINITLLIKYCIKLTIKYFPKINNKDILLTQINKVNQGNQGDLIYMTEYINNINLTQTQRNILNIESIFNINSEFKTMLFFSTILQYFETRNMNLFKFNLNSNSNSIDSFNIDIDYYYEINPLNLGLFKSNNELLLNYKKHGISQNILCNKLQFKLNYMCQTNINNNLLNELSLKIIEEYKTINTNELSIFNLFILTRTCNREIKLMECINSINNQYECNSHPSLKPLMQFIKINHIISYDTYEAQDYLNKIKKETYNINYTIDTLNLIAFKNIEHPNQYIHHFYNKIKNNNLNGWILVLDDDDKFNNNNILLYLYSKYINTKMNLLSVQNMSFVHSTKYFDNLINSDMLFIWMLNRPDKFIYPLNKLNPKIGEIGTCSYIYHTNKVDLLEKSWNPNAEGDFNPFNILFKNCKSMWIDYPLTTINYNDKISGWSC